MWNLLGLEISRLDTWCACSANTLLLWGAAAPSDVSHRAHALACAKHVLQSLRGMNHAGYLGEPRNFEHFFFQTPKRASFSKTGRNTMVHIFVYQRELQVYNIYTILYPSFLCCLLSLKLCFTRHPAGHKNPKRTEVLTALIIWKVPFTNVDWEAYMAEAWSP